MPEHFYAEVLAVLRRRSVIERDLPEAQAMAAVTRLRGWHLHRASISALIESASAYRHNMTAADALYVVLAEHLQADFLTDDRNLVEAPTFPPASTSFVSRPSQDPAVRRPHSRITGVLGRLRAEEVGARLRGYCPSRPDLESDRMPAARTRRLLAQAQ